MKEKKMKEKKMTGEKKQKFQALAAQKSPVTA
jgi:hypothetical protein